MPPNNTKPNYTTVTPTTTTTTTTTTTNNHPPQPTSSLVPPIFQHFSPLNHPENPKMKEDASSATAPIHKKWKVPLLRLKVNDICSEGSSAFFAVVNAEKLLREAVVGVLESLYTYKSAPTSVRSVTLILRSMGGVAYTTGSDLDNDHKEIHFSTDYIQGVHERSQGKQDLDEILGVIRHEMVHCFQFNGKNTCNGGLIEGVADWVRLQAGFIPPHWAVGGGSKWDEGYQNTAYFLQYLEDHYGAGSVMKINEYLRDRTYSDKLFVELFGKKPEILWQEYKKMAEEIEKSKKEQPSFVTLVTPKPTTSEASGSSSSSPTAIPTPSGSASAKSVNISDDANDTRTAEEIRAEAVKKFVQSAPIFQPSETTQLARARLATLRYDSDTMLRAEYVAQFDKLVELIEPPMTDELKIFFLNCSFSTNRARNSHRKIFDEGNGKLSYDEYKQRWIQDC